MPGSICHKGSQRPIRLLRQSLGTLYHEVGHFLDHLHSLGTDQRIAAAYADDVQRMRERVDADKALTPQQIAAITDGMTTGEEAIANALAYGMANVGEDNRLAEPMKHVPKYLPALYHALSTHPKLQGVMRR